MRLTKEKQHKRKKGNSVQNLIGIKTFTNYGLAVNKYELLFFLVSPTNISVLSSANIEIKIRHLMMVLSSIPNIEIMLAKLYVALINGVISSDKYLNMLPIIDKWQKYDSNTLKTIYNEHKKTTLNMEYGNRDYVISIDLASKQRLESLGLIGITREVKDLLKEFGEIDEKDIKEIKEEGQYCLDERYKLTYEGVILAEILFEDKVLTKFNKDYFNVSYI